MNDAKSQFLDFLESRSLKSTPQRRLIVDIFLKSGHHLSTEDLYGLVREADNNVGQATVYRTLRLLCEAGLARELHFGDGIARYEPAVDDTHHDHLICKSCGKNIEVIDENIEKLQVKLAAKHGFTLTSHRMYLYGTCKECSAPLKRGKAKKKVVPLRQKGFSIS